MLRTRVIPCLLLKKRSLVKTVRFKNPQYIGDPINTVRIYNEKEVDEIVFLDITATAEQRRPGFDLLEEIASECFMPFSYGGGVRRLDDAKRILALGCEKIALNAYALESPDFIREAADALGSQSVIVSMDVKRVPLRGYRVMTRSGSKRTSWDPVRWAEAVQQQGAGEILLTSVDRDGTFDGYDLDLIKQVTRAVDIPVIACGGAGRVEDFGLAVREGGAAAVAAGSMVVYQGKGRGVLINFPSHAVLREHVS